MIAVSPAAIPAEAEPEALPAHLRELTGLLAVPRQQIETAFVDVGAQLSECAGLLNQITLAFEELPRDMERPEMIEATDRLATLSVRAQEISASFAAEQSDIARLVEVVTAADGPISDLRKAVKMMGIVAINARVVAASVVGHRDDFGVFTTDIAALSEGAARTIDEFSLVYRQLAGEVHDAAEQRRHFEATHKDTLGALAAQLQASLAEVVRHRQASAAGSAETGRVSRHISQRIASAVMALQVGDSTRQRIEHVETSLHALADLAEGKMVAGTTVSSGDRSAVLTCASELMVAQLGDTAKAFESDIAQAERALRELVVDAQTVMGRSHDIYGQGGGESDTPLARLSREMRQAVAVLHDCEIERGKLEGVAAAVQATVRVLLDHVEAVQLIEANMRLVSLNAAVKCAQLGTQGRALNVIAQQLRDLTGETVLAADAAMSNLGNAAALANSFSEASSGEAAGSVAGLEEEAVASISLFKTCESRLDAALGILNREGPAAVKLLGQAASGFSGKAEITEAMADVQFRIEELAAANADATGNWDASGPVLSFIRGTYTMDAERRIHDRVTGSHGTMRLPSANPPAEVEQDDIFF